LAVGTPSVIECRDAQDGRLIGRTDEALGASRFKFQVPPLAITPNGSRVFFGNPARAWTVGQPVADALMENIDAADVVALAENGLVAVTAPDYRELVAIEVRTGQKISRIRNSRDFSCLALARDGRVVATGDFEHDVKLWDLKSPETQPSQWEGRGRVSSTAICDDRNLAFVSAGEVRELWDTGTGVALERQGIVASDRVVRRSERLLEQHILPKIQSQLAEVLGAKQRKSRYRRSMVPVGVLALSLPAHRAVSAPRYGAKLADREEMPHGRDHPLQLWDIENIRELRLLHGHTSPITCADITADGTRALTGSSRRLLRLWDLDAGVCLRILRGHRGIVFNCALTDDARLAVSGSEDMTVRLWDLAQGKLLFTFAASSAVSACDIARDGSVAIAGEISGRVHTFSIDKLMTAPS
jgi:WD40 repeat protein